MLSSTDHGRRHWQKTTLTDKLTRYLHMIPQWTNSLDSPVQILFTFAGCKTSTAFRIKIEFPRPGFNLEKIQNSWDFRIRRMCQPRKKTRLQGERKKNNWEFRNERNTTYARLFSFLNISVKICNKQTNLHATFSINLTFNLTNHRGYIRSLME